MLSKGVLVFVGGGRALVWKRSPQMSSFCLKWHVTPPWKLTSQLENPPWMSRCISYRKLEDFPAIAMLVFTQGCIINFSQTLAVKSTIKSIVPWNGSWNKPPTKTILGGGYNDFSFSPLPGEMIQFDEHIFSSGWFNHQLESSLLGVPFFLVVLPPKYGFWIGGEDSFFCFPFGSVGGGWGLGWELANFFEVEKNPIKKASSRWPHTNLNETGTF